MDCCCFTTEFILLCHEGEITCEALRVGLLTVAMLPSAVRPVVLLVGVLEARELTLL